MCSLAAKLVVEVRSVSGSNSEVQVQVEIRARSFGMLCSVACSELHFGVELNGPALYQARAFAVGCRCTAVEQRATGLQPGVACAAGGGVRVPSLTQYRASERDPDRASHTLIRHR